MKQYYLKYDVLVKQMLFVNRMFVKHVINNRMF